MLLRWIVLLPIETVPVPETSPLTLMIRALELKLTPAVVVLWNWSHATLPGLLMNRCATKLKSPYSVDADPSMIANGGGGLSGRGARSKLAAEAVSKGVVGTSAQAIANTAASMG